MAAGRENFIFFYCPLDGLRFKERMGDQQPRLPYELYIDERTAYDSKLKKSIPVSWAVSWSLSYNAPRQPNSNRYYYGDTQLDGQSGKKYDNKGAAQRYIQGRADFYAHLFMELSPPIRCAIFLLKKWNTNSIRAMGST